MTTSETLPKRRGDRHKQKLPANCEIASHQAAFRTERRRRTELIDYSLLRRLFKNSRKFRAVAAAQRIHSYERRPQQNDVEWELLKKCKPYHIKVVRPEFSEVCNWCKLGTGTKTSVHAKVLKRRSASTLAGQEESPKKAADSTDFDSEGVDLSPEDILHRLPLVADELKASLICDAETLQFDRDQRSRLSALLWDYIRTNRDSRKTDALVAVGSAIRKYVAMLNVERIGEIAELLDAGHRAQLPLHLELEVVKMIYRKFEANPPTQPDGQRILAERLLEMAEGYATRRQILRDYHASIAALSIEAIVAMRSERAGDALKLASKREKSVRSSSGIEGNMNPAESGAVKDTAYTRISVGN